MVRFEVPDASSSEDEKVETLPPKTSSPPGYRLGGMTFPPQRKGILKPPTASGQHYHKQQPAVEDPSSGSFRVPSTDSSPVSDNPSPSKDIAALGTLRPGDSPTAPGSPSPSSRPSPPLFSPQFGSSGARKNHKPDPFPLRGNQRDRIKKRVWRTGRGRHVLVRTVPEENGPSESEIRATKRLLSYPGLIRLLDHRGFQAEVYGEARSTKRPRETEWDFADLGTLQDTLDQERHEQGLPENFVWHVLQSLLKTALYLHTGIDFDADVQQESALLSPSIEDRALVQSPKNSSTTADADPTPSWNPIVHNQINPWNISFYSHDEKDPPGTPLYPHVKLGNLSRVTILPSLDHQATHEDFPPLPTALQTNFEAPEMAWKYQFGPAGTKSDLWSIAAVGVVIMGGVGGIARKRRVEIWDDVAGRYHGENPCSDEALFRETSRMIQVEKWRWTAADLNQRYPGKYSMELRCFLERLLTMVPQQRPDTLEAVVWASNYYVHWLRSVNAPQNPAAETGVHVDELEEDSDTQHRVDVGNRVGGTTPMRTPSPERVPYSKRAPLDPRTEQVELPNLDAEAASYSSSEDLELGPPAHLLRELELKKKLQHKSQTASSRE